MSDSTEHAHQVALFQWASTRKDLRLMYAIPNSAKRTPRQGAWMKQEGMKAGCPDLALPVARQGCHGLYIELKRPKSPGKPAGRLSPIQSEWLEMLRAEGYSAQVCYGWENAKNVIEDYMRT